MGYKLTWMYIGTQKVRPPLQLYWNISGAVEAGTCNLNQSNNYDECLEFSKDWLHFYTSSDATGNWPYQVDLWTAWDVTTATGQTDLHSSMYYWSSWNGNWTPHWNADWTQCTNAYWYTIKWWTPWSPYDLSQSRTEAWSATYSWVNLGRWWKFINNWNKIIAQWWDIMDLSTPYDLRTMWSTPSSSNSNISWADNDYFVTDNWLHVYMASPDVWWVNHYTLTTPWDLTTATLTETFSQSNATWIYFHWDKMYLKYRSSAVKQFTVTTVS